MSHSQFHCTGRVYLHVHGLIFETSICYWQDQPGSRTCWRVATGEPRARLAADLRALLGGGWRTRASGPGADRSVTRAPAARPAPPRHAGWVGGRGRAQAQLGAVGGSPAAPPPERRRRGSAPRGTCVPSCWRNVLGGAGAASWLAVGTPALGLALRHPTPSTLIGPLGEAAGLIGLRSARRGEPPTRGRGPSPKTGAYPRHGPKAGGSQLLETTAEAGQAVQP